MKDLLKMTKSERTNYLLALDLDECNKQIINFTYECMSPEDRSEYSKLFNKSQKLMLGNNKSWENKKQSVLNFNIILIKLIVLLVLNHYDKFIKWSDKL